MAVEKRVQPSHASSGGGIWPHKTLRATRALARWPGGRANVGAGQIRVSTFRRLQERSTRKDPQVPLEALVVIDAESSLGIPRSEREMMVGNNGGVVSGVELAQTMVARPGEGKSGDRPNGESQHYYDSLGPWATRKAVTAAFKVDSATLDKWRADKRVLGVAFGRSYFYPVHQFNDGQIVAGLQEVLRALSAGFTTSEAQAGWLAEKAYQDSPVTRWEILRDGQRATVVGWARADAARVSQPSERPAGSGTASPSN